MGNVRIGYILCWVYSLSQIRKREANPYVLDYLLVSVLCCKDIASFSFTVLSYFLHFGFLLWTGLIPHKDLGRPLRMLWSQQVYIKLTWHLGDLRIQLWCHSIDTTFPKNIATTLYMKSSFQITQISFLHEYRNIICTLFLFGNHYSQKVQFSNIYIVQIFN